MRDPPHLFQISGLLRFAHLEFVEVVHEPGGVELHGGRGFPTASEQVRACQLLGLNGIPSLGAATPSFGGLEMAKARRGIGGLS